LLMPTSVGRAMKTNWCACLVIELLSELAKRTGLNQQCREAPCRDSRELASNGNASFRAKKMGKNRKPAVSKASRQRPPWRSPLL
jgi:hypothetical protein